MSADSRPPDLPELRVAATARRARWIVIAAAFVLFAVAGLVFAGGGPARNGLELTDPSLHFDRGEPK